MPSKASRGFRGINAAMNPPHLFHVPLDPFPGITPRTRWARSGEHKWVRFRERRGQLSPEREIWTAPPKAGFGRGRTETQFYRTAGIPSELPVKRGNRLWIATVRFCVSAVAATGRFKNLDGPLWVGSSRSRGWNLPFDATMASRAVDRWTPAARSTQSCDRIGRLGVREFASQAEPVAQVSCLKIRVRTYETDYREVSNLVTNLNPTGVGLWHIALAPI
jgi:hypothetical protein